MSGRIPGDALFGGQMPPGASMQPSPPMGPGGAPGGPGQAPDSSGDPTADLIEFLMSQPPEVLESIGLPPDFIEQLMMQVEAKTTGGGMPGSPMPQRGGPGGAPGGAPPPQRGGGFKDFLRSRQ